MVVEEKSWFKPQLNFHYSHLTGTSNILEAVKLCSMNHYSYTNLHDYTFGDSEMLCKEGRQDFDLCTAAGFVDPPDLCLCLSALPPWNSLCTLASLLKIMVKLIYRYKHF